ncbi:MULTISPECIES: exodeoxyribonuclease VII large subunit [unclassified Massilia]|uniref:exodeoxyribonuclease VII large subunit n=1 Tax=unclassified Massilia TaxID=2609279 RepID=UPI001B8270E1|nr:MULTISPECIES: exodeoxyribonuclease VII large subunit [unclassified Massilia]MBQ5938623.1 exodeoxyribonuclease VII large subunit [Massilia sp. AB1]MBQ5964613.1 exodeoxyribonuclease VII large subunit [Massilia sp. ZL223]
MQRPPDADPAYTAPPVMTVTALNQQVARLLERSFPLVWIGGEISNFTRASSGHWYFTLKDDAAQVRAVMFRSRAQMAGFTPREGDKVEVRALVTLYGARGDYQINVEAMRRAGVGQLYEAFLRLKEKLAAQGLFDQDRKRALPLFPRTIGIVTSPQAAALRDVLTALRRRAPHVRVILYPAPVQGQFAADKIAEAITTASRRAEADVLLVCRGGGSIEDLWCFNEECVARAIAACSIPVISGVGHETDFTIADFAADMRAATPTAAAELAATPRADWIGSLQADALDLRRAMRRTLSDASQGLDSLSRRLLSPSDRIGHQRLKLLSMATAMTHAAQHPINRQGLVLAQLRQRWARHRPDIRAVRAQLLSDQRHLNASLCSQVKQRRDALGALAAQLELLNPQRTLERGYAIVRDAKGQVLRDPAAIHARDTLTLRLAGGSAEVGVAHVQSVLE